MTTKTKEKGKETVQETVYYFDGRDDNNDKHGSKKTKWTGKKLVVTSKSVVRAITIGGRSPTMETKEEWELSKDRTTLTQTISGTGLGNMSPPPKSKFVYSRIPG